MTELLRGLLPESYPDYPHRRQDERPLVQRYALLVPACTSDFVREMLIVNGEPFQWDKWRVRQTAQYHWPILQQLMLNTLRSENITPAPGTVVEGEAAKSLMRLYLPYLLEEVPQVPGHERGFSASMSFSLEVLRKLAAGAELKFLTDDFESRLILPLIRRAIEGKAKVHSLCEIVDLTLAYLERHPDKCRNTHFSNDTFPAFVARVWTIQPETFESQLIAILKRQSYGGPKKVDTFRHILDVVKPEHRYHLLRLVILCSEGLRTDIDNDQGLENLPIRTWPSSIFLSLPPGKARKLLQRLTQLKPEGRFLQLPARSPHLSLHSILSQPPSIGSGNADPKLILTLLNAEGKNAEEDTREAVEHYKEKAFKSREQVDRAFYARSAAFYAIASGSLDLYGQIVVWLRRFLRDPLSVKTIYSSDAVNTEEGVALLSDIPTDLSRYELRHVHDMVLKANKVIVDLFETAILAMSEPSFYRHDWEGPKLVFRHVIEARITQSHRLKNALSVTKNDMYNALWAPTLEIFLKIENAALQPENEALAFHSPHGLLFPDGIRNSSPPLSAFSPGAYRFIDNVAKARDQLWQQHRPTLHSECVSLHKI